MMQRKITKCTKHIHLGMKFSKMHSEILKLLTYFNYCRYDDLLFLIIRDTKYHHRWSKCLNFRYVSEVRYLKKKKKHKKKTDNQNGSAFGITKTYLYNFDPLKPHFYIVKLGFTGVYIIFLISAQNIDCGSR